MGKKIDQIKMTDLLSELKRYGEYIKQENKKYQKEYEEEEEKRSEALSCHQSEYLKFQVLRDKLIVKSNSSQIFRPFKRRDLQRQLNDIDTLLLNCSRNQIRCVNPPHQIYPTFGGFIDFLTTSTPEIPSSE